jgi:hypothetical protein
MTKAKAKSVSPRKAQALLAEGGWSKDETLSDPVFHVYVDSKNRALQLVRSNGGGQLYENRDELVRFLEQVAARQNQPDRHPLEGRLAHGADFVSHVPELVASLPAALGLDTLPPCTLDGLAAVEDAVRRVGYARCQKQDLFSALVAFAGEVMRAEANGHWFGVQSGEVVEPWIRGANGRTYPVFAIVYKELRRGRNGSIRGAVGGSLKSHLLG